MKKIIAENAFAPAINEYRRTGQQTDASPEAAARAAETVGDNGGAVDRINNSDNLE